MKFFLQIVFIIRREASFLAQSPQRLLTGALLACVPALYCILYITSVWDPETKTAALPVAVVNLDEGVEYREHKFNVGWEIATRLEDSGRFGFVMLKDEQKARALVRQGQLAFAVIIPADFSANAVPGAEAGAGKVVIYTSQGNNFETAAIAKHFAEALGQAVNESLNERRWGLVLHNAAGSQRTAENLHESVDSLRAHARELRTGTRQAAADVQSLSSRARSLSDSVGQMSAGVKQLGGSLRAIDASLPSSNSLNKLANQAKALETGHSELSRTTDELQRRFAQLRTRAAELRNEATQRQYVFTSGTDELGIFADSMTQLEADIKIANASQNQLSSRVTRLKNNVNAAVKGLRTLSGDEKAATIKLPKDSEVDDLAKGANEVASKGANLVTATQKINRNVERISKGIDVIAQTLPDKMDSLEGSPEGLANSVLPVVEVDAPVENSGSGFASNVVPGALWLGAALAVFLVHVRVLPRHAQFFSRPAKVAGKVFVPACVALAQALMVFLAVRYVLKVHILLPWALTLTLMVSSLTFLFIVFALTKAFGDAGRGIAMFLLAVQLSSSGGILPVELSGGIFAAISPWLPLTWVVEGVKASMFGAFGGAWQDRLLLTGLAGLASFALSCAVGRWRFVMPQQAKARNRY